MSLLTITAITSLAHDHLPFVQQLYETAFPPEERRVFSSIAFTPAQAGAEATMQLLLAQDATLAPVAFAFVWDFKYFRFIEHLATAPEYRGKGYGNYFMQLLQPAGKPCLLEAEPPHDEQSERRIRFYNRLGFTQSSISYLQPPYHTGGAALPMLLLANPSLPAATALDYAARVHTTVYALSAPLCPPGGEKVQ